MPLRELVSLYDDRHPDSRVELLRAESSGISLAISGEIDMKVATDLGPLLEAALLACPAHGRFLLDLAGVAYISSTGVGLLASVMVQAQKRSISLVLAQVPPKVRSIMDILGLMGFFHEETEAP
jgi:anti-anti-sigma factor